MNSSSSKIMLKNTSSMSLDERFTMILKNQQMPLTHRRTVPEQLTSSVKNQLLAQQMPNRPSVVAALQSHLNVKRYQFKSSVKSRLGRPTSMRGLSRMPRSWERQRGRGTLMKQVLSKILINASLSEQQPKPFVSRGGPRLSRGLRGALRGKGPLFVGCGSAGRSSRPASRPVPTREELDAQLDDYMSLTKRKLDAQLDAYMAEVDHEDLLQ
ncbi:chromatin target of PRMT1b isoform X3 [Silurus asotus]|uniref:Chromatin target of PRMT1b isoform X3 n=1 Tax=Silurus asotus TaxID=30991 RepID=A0AAD5AKZ6_SILAS|nr:chromatin target of PRMT1b isoform X3 [Silurus asotus]